MSLGFLTALGFLGLLGIAVLILIYLLKPNYQQKVISSTFVWKLSLKYRKRKVPISKLRNILLILCQFLIVIVCAWILAQPIIKHEIELQSAPEGVLIIDTSANMMTESDGSTRFGRALEKASEYIDSIFDQNGNITIIMAGETPKIVGGEEFFRVNLNTQSKRNTLKEALYDESCAYGRCNPDSALERAETILNINPNAEVLFYTATEYTSTGLVQVVDVKSEGSVEWNAAILNCEVTPEDNDHLFTIEVACYDREQDIELLIDIIGANAYEDEPGVDIRGLKYSVRCTVDTQGKAITTIAEFHAEDCGYNEPISTFQYVYVRFNGVDDCFSADNSYYVYGLVKDTIDIQIWSSSVNSFFNLGLLTLSNRLQGTHEINVKQLTSNQEPAREGFDIYLFEHAIPENIRRDGLPTDGIVFLCDPDSADGLDAGFSVESHETTTPLKQVVAGETHALTRYLRMENIMLTKYRKISSYDYNYTELMSCDGSPVMIARNDPDCKVVVMSFSVNYSTLAIKQDFMVLLMNMINYFAPLTMEKRVTNVGESLSLNARGASLSLVGDGVSEVISTFPHTFTFTKPGTYVITQELISGEVKEEYVYVRISAAESDIFRVEDTLTILESQTSYENEHVDLLLYFAIALVALLFAEWFLQSKEYFV